MQANSVLCVEVLRHALVASRNYNNFCRENFTPDSQQ